LLSIFFRDFAEAMAHERTTSEEERIMNNMIGENEAGAADEAGFDQEEFSSQFLDLENFEQRDASGRDDSGHQQMEGEEVDGSGSRTLVVSKSGEVYIYTDYIDALNISPLYIHVLMILSSFRHLDRATLLKGRHEARPKGCPSIQDSQSST
jgi:hypothetical protein